jgi:hypothetical protein
MGLGPVYVDAMLCFFSGYDGMSGACSPNGKLLPIQVDDWCLACADHKPDLAVLCKDDAWPQHTCTLLTNVTDPPGFDAASAGVKVLLIMHAFGCTANDKPF